MSVTATTTALDSSQPQPRPSLDIELMAIPSVVSREAGERDPLLLRERIKPDKELEGLRSRRSRKDSLLADFYEAQNGHIDKLLKPMAVHTAEGKQDESDMALKVKIAVNVSFAANIVLAIVQLYSAISSGSLALFASCVDAGALRGSFTCVRRD